MSKDLVEQLVIDKAHVAQVAHTRLGIIGALALLHGNRKKSGVVELRLTKAQVGAVNNHGVRVRSLKRGGLVIEVREFEEEETE